MPSSRDCDLCLSEKVAIMRVQKDHSYLNKRNELKKYVLTNKNTSSKILRYLEFPFFIYFYISIIDGSTDCKHSLTRGATIMVALRNIYKNDK